VLREVSPNGKRRLKNRSAVLVTNRLRHATESRPNGDGTTAAIPCEPTGAQGDGKSVAFGAMTRKHLGNDETLWVRDVYLGVTNADVHAASYRGLAAPRDRQRTPPRRSPHGPRKQTPCKPWHSGLDHLSDGGFMFPLDDRLAPEI
jgi:hypothetical protein